MEEVISGTTESILKILSLIESYTISECYIGYVLFWNSNPKTLFTLYGFDDKNPNEKLICLHDLCTVFVWQFYKNTQWTVIIVHSMLLIINREQIIVLWLFNRR